MNDRVERQSAPAEILPFMATRNQMNELQSLVGKKIRCRTEMQANNRLSQSYRAWISNISHIQTFMSYHKNELPVHSYT